MDKEIMDELKNKITNKMFCWVIGTLVIIGVASFTTTFGMVMSSQNNIQEKVEVLQILTAKIDTKLNIYVANN